MKHVIQLNYPEMPYVTRTGMEGEAKEKGKHTTIKSSGCGLCSAIMVAERLVPEANFSLEEAIQLSYDTNSNTRAGTGYSTFAPAFAEKFGLSYERSGDFDKALDCLHYGGVVVVNVGGDRDGHIGVFSHVGHYVVLINQEPDGRLAILDPAYSKGRYEEEGRLGKVEVTHGSIALCTKEVLIKDTENRQTPFHLFRRK